MCLNANILLLFVEKNWGHYSILAEAWVMLLAQPFFSENFSCSRPLCGKGRAAEKPAGIAGKQVAPSNLSVCGRFLLFLWRANCIGLLLGLVTLSWMSIVTNEVPWSLLFCTALVTCCFVITASCVLAHKNPPCMPHVISWAFLAFSMRNTLCFLTAYYRHLNLQVQVC